MKRFFKRAQSVADDGGYIIALDGRPIKTPAGRILRLPSPSLADDIAREWNALEDQIVPSMLPFTQLANTSLDRTDQDRPRIAQEIVAFANTDLLCYRADHPAPLIERQAAAWDPVLGWASEALGVTLRATSSIQVIEQEPASLKRLYDIVSSHDAFELTALHRLTHLTGSVVLGLGAAYGAFSVDQAWDASTVDECFQAERWGADTEAQSALENKKAEYLAAARFWTSLNVDKKER